MTAFGARSPGFSGSDSESIGLAVAILAALGDPEKMKANLAQMNRIATEAKAERDKADKAKAELEAAQRAHDQREQSIRAAEQRATKVDREHRLRRQELADMADAVHADRQKAAKELSDARETAKAIIADADGKSAAAESTARAALAQHSNLKQEIAALEKQREAIKAELKALVGRITG
jgi:chromosome segregation ATPase